MNGSKSFLGDVAMQGWYFEEKFLLNDSAKSISKTTEFLQNLNLSDSGKDEILEARELLNSLLDLAKGNRAYESQHSMEFIQNGLENMFRVMNQNQAYTSAPIDGEDRKDFYQKLGKGFRQLAQRIQGEYEQKNLGKQEVYSILETIGEGGYACAGRWRQVLEELLKGFSHRMEEGALPNPHLTDPLYHQMQELLHKAMEIEVGRFADGFLSLYYEGVGEESKLHFTSFFKRVLNKKQDYHLTITMEEDSYLKSQEEILEEKIEDFLTGTPLEDHIAKRFIHLFQDGTNQEGPLYGLVVQDAIRRHKKDPLKEEYPDVVEFLSQKVFQGESKQLRKEAIVDLLLEKGFVRITLEKRRVSEKLNHYILEKNYDDLERFLAKLPKEALSKEDKDCLYTLVRDDLSFLLNAKRMKRNTLLKVLIEEVLDFNMEDKDSRTILFWALEKGFSEMVKALLERGANVNHQDLYGVTPLILAAKSGHTDTLNLLLQSGADLEKEDHYGLTALVWAGAHGNFEIGKRLMDAGADLNHQDKNGSTALIWSSKTGHKAMVEALLAKGAKAELTNHNGEHALIWAAKNGRDEIVRELIRKGVPVNLPDGKGGNALRWAVTNGQTQTIKLLLNYGADVNQMDSFKATPLILAARLGYSEIARQLCDRGADINHQDMRGNTALMGAVENRDESMVKVLYARGAKITILNKKGKNAYDLALESDFSKTILMLKIWEKERLFKKMQKKNTMNQGKEL
jgi:uncharacterized protein